MKVLVTGANGFIGKNIVSKLSELDDVEVYLLNRETPLKKMEEYCQKCDFVYNLVGINRPEHEEEFMKGNFGFVSTLVDTLQKYGNKCPIMNASSIQATLENPYGRSKRAAEQMLFSYGEKVGAEIYIYRFQNIFGKWCQPNYNSVIATFCYNITHDIPIHIKDEHIELDLVYIDDVIEELLLALKGKPHKKENGYCYVPIEYHESLGHIAELLYSFKKSRENLMIPEMIENGFTKKLYSMYISYLPENAFAYSLQMHKDERGSFTEILKSIDRGQVSVNISKPGVTKGNHWHHSKNEKFIVLSGKALIRFRKHGGSQIIEYHTSGEMLQVIDIPTGYTHAIVNEGETDLVTLMWCNECFDPNKPDTIYELVEEKENDSI